MKFLRINFKKIFYITGNHEYYNNTKMIQETNDFLEKYFQPFNNISFLNNIINFTTIIVLLVLPYGVKL